VLRSRSTAISAEALTGLLKQASTPGINGAAAGSASVMLNLFGDTQLPFFAEKVETTADGIGRTVSGRVGEAGEGTALFTIYQGAISGSVRLQNGEFYDFFVPTTGAGELRQVHFQGYVHPETDAVPVALDEAGSKSAASSQTEPEPWDLVRAASGPEPTVNQNTATVVDVLVAYTQRARETRGGTSGMLAHINQVIAETNTAFTTSAVDIQFRLAHAVEVSYDDSQSSMSYSSALSALRSSSDAKMDEVHSLRDQYGADLVTLWVNPPTGTGSFTVGMAYMLTSNPAGFGGFAFSVVNQAYAGGSSASFPHEAGHNLGLNHDADNGGSNGGIYPYARGYQQKTLDPKFFTIMAYASGCSGCTPLIQFSNPAVSYQSIPTGVANVTDAARALNQVAPYAGAWRGATSTPTCSYSLSPTLLSATSAGGSFNVSVSTGSGCPWTPATSASWMTLSNDSARSGPGSFSFTVAANLSSSSRSGTVSAGGRSANVSQAGVTAAPALIVSRSSVALSSSVGSRKSASASISVSTDGATVPVTVSGTLPGWLTVSPTSFQTPASITISANPIGLAAGTYTASVTLSSSLTANGTVQVGVSFTVKESAKVRRSAKAVSFQSDISQVPATQVVEVEASAGVSDMVLTAGDASWVNVSGVRSGERWRFTVATDPHGLSNGVYDTELELVCAPLACDPAAIPVRLVVQNTASTGTPKIASGGVVNAASYQPGMASGAWMSIFGSNFAARSRSWNTADFVGNRMPTSLEGVQVLVEGQPAAIHFVSPGQVNFQAPSGLLEGWARVEIRTPGGIDSAFVYASREAPGFFQLDGNGNLAALHPDGVPVGANGPGAPYVGRPAMAGEVIAIYGTGFGPTSPALPAGETFSGSASLVDRADLAVTIGGVAARVDYAGLTGAGLNQINVAVPSLPGGIYDVVATLGSSATQFHGKLLVAPYP
jgi:uncharacterized protein (TIGR03437 family)